jgi:hypothetical protein
LGCDNSLSNVFSTYTSKKIGETFVVVFVYSQFYLQYLLIFYTFVDNHIWFIICCLQSLLMSGGEMYLHSCLPLQVCSFWKLRSWTDFCQTQVKQGPGLNDSSTIVIEFTVPVITQLLISLWLKLFVAISRLDKQPGLFQTKNFFLVAKKLKKLLMSVF